MTGLSCKVTKSTNDKSLGATPWRPGSIDSLEGFDYDWMQVELAVLAKSGYKKS